jgi:hypothetical protein
MAIKGIHGNVNTKYSFFMYLKMRVSKKYKSSGADDGINWVDLGKIKGTGFPGRERPYAYDPAIISHS